MKFGRTLRERTIKEWRFYCVDYKVLKQTINLIVKESADESEFFRLINRSENKLFKFYHDKEQWALTYMKTLEERVDALRESALSSSTPSPSVSSSSWSSDTSVNSAEGKFLKSTNQNNNNQNVTIIAIPNNGINELTLNFDKLSKRNLKGNDYYGFLKDEYRRVGRSKHFQDYIYAKKSLVTFAREIELLLEFLRLNKTAFSKILKKFDKKTRSAVREAKLNELMQRHAYLNGETLQTLNDQLNTMIDEVNSLKPRLPDGWEQRKVYTIGCFDLFHRGHQNLLLSLREFGCYVVAGVQDDESYFELKNKYTIDNVETRVANVRPYVDQLFVLPPKNQLDYIKSMVSDRDIETGACCYARGDDMTQFPDRDWVESVMPVHFVPRTEGCSSTLIRTIYHADNQELRVKAAFAKTRYDGKPIDENGNVLNLKE